MIILYEIEWSDIYGQVALIVRPGPIGLHNFKKGGQN